MKEIIILSTFFISYFPILFFSAFIPYLTRKTESFGVTIPEEIYDNDEVKSLRTLYRNNVLSFGLVLAAFALVTGFVAPVEVTNIFLPVGTLVQLVIMFAFYLKGHKRMKALKLESNWTSGKHQAVVIDTDFRKRKLTVSPLWFMLYVVIITVTLAIGFSFFDSMPEKVPMQYNLSGEVSRYADKSYRLILFAPLMQAFITLLMAFVYWIVGKSKQQIDASNPEKSLEQSRVFRYRWSAFTVFCGFAMVALFAFMQLSIVGLVGSSLATTFVPLGVTGIVIGAAVALSVTTGQGGSRIAISEKKDGELVNRDEDNCWKLGIFYYNPEDPSVFVEKRFGIGWTCNFARPLSWAFIGGLAVFIILMVVLSDYLAR